MTKCPVCGKPTLRRERRKSELYGFGLGEYQAEVCSSCGETFWSEKDMEVMEKKARKLKIWGLEKKTKVSIAGNSLIIRIPRELAKFVGLEKGKEVIVHPMGKDKLLVEEIRQES